MFEERKVKEHRTEFANVNFIPQAASHLSIVESVREVREPDQSLSIHQVSCTGKMLQ